MSHKLFDIFKKIINWNNSSEKENLNDSVPLPPKLSIDAQPKQEDLTKYNKDDLLNNTKSIEYQERESQYAELDKRADETMTENLDPKHY